MDRRNFIKTSSYGIIGSSLLLQSVQGQASRPATTSANANEILLSWCKGLLQHQVTEVKTPGIYGGIIDPGSSRMKGRLWESVYPFWHAADKFNDEAFWDAGVRVLEWSEHVSLPDGSWKVEPQESTWVGTTVFNVAILAEALYRYGDKLPATLQDKWQDRLYRGAEWVYQTMDFEWASNINYPASTPLALHAAQRVLKENKYGEKARQMIPELKKFFSPEHHLLRGEGKPNLGKSPRGCYPIDIGYNVEESIPNLIHYQMISGDKRLDATIQESMKSHLMLMIPDGGWDNSFGTRNFKWTYWGSRTTDGCQLAYGTQQDPLLQEAAFRNLELLQKCTSDRGLIFGGPHVRKAGYLEDIHHTFTHAKGLALALDYGMPVQLVQRRNLPRESQKENIHLPETDTYLMAEENWRASFTGMDFTYDKDLATASGGALSLLYHLKAGPLAIASLTEYYLKEAHNQQMHKPGDGDALTPRIEVEDSSGKYYSCSDHSAVMKSSQGYIEVRGRLRGEKQRHPKGGVALFSMQYSFTSKALEVEAVLLPNGKLDTADFIFPIIADSSESAKMENKQLVIRKQNGSIVKISSNHSIQADIHRRNFNQVPGVQSIPVVINMKKGNKVTLKIEVA